MYSEQGIGVWMKFSLSVGVLLSRLLVSLASVAYGQDSRGTLAGRVTDSGGAVIAGADVTVTNVQTAVSVTARTNESGIFSIPFLLPSSYRVQTARLSCRRAVAKLSFQMVASI